MAKKGGVQQLQAELLNDEDFEKFLEKPGLLVIDVYSEWCGPCLGMIGSLKKIKLELGGDSLQLAIAKADGITALKRFQRKSEPTWLFIHKGRSTNLFFGSNVPRLMKLIASELTALSSKVPRVTYAITEPQPEEVKRNRIKQDIEEAAVRAEEAKKAKERRDYLMHVTDTIIDNLPDMGVTIFGPHVSRDIFKKIMEPAEGLKIQCKDRRTITVKREDFDVINFACKNPMEPIVIDQFHEKECLMCFWKMPEIGGTSVSVTLEALSQLLTLQRVEPPDDFNPEERIIPAIISPQTVKIDVPIEEGEEYSDEESDEDTAAAMERKKSRQEVTEEEDEEGDEGEEEEGSEGGEGGEGGVVQPMDEETPFALDLPPMGSMEDLLGLTDDKEEVFEEEEKVQTRKKKVVVPAIWVPNNQRTHAALIYVYFRQQTAPFLPPDPVPDPPCIIMAFDAYKKRDLVSMAERYKDDVPAYGFFTSDDAQDAKCIAKNAEKYAKAQQTAGDKIVIKVNKVTSNTMLSFATYGPSYVSPDTVIGGEEAVKFFPDDYHEEVEEVVEEEEDKKKKKKKRKTDKEASIVQKAAAEAEAAAAAAAAAEQARQGSVTAPAPGSGEESGETSPTAAPGEEGAAPVQPPAEGEEGAAPAAAAAETAPEAAPTDEAPAGDGVPPPEEAPPPADAPPADEAQPTEAAAEEAPPPPPPEAEAEAAPEPPPPEPEPEPAPAPAEEAPPPPPPAEEAPAPAPEAEAPAAAEE